MSRNDNSSRLKGSGMRSSHYRIRTVLRSPFPADSAGRGARNALFLLVVVLPEGLVDVGVEQVAGAVGGADILRLQALELGPLQSRTNTASGGTRKNEGLISAHFPQEGMNNEDCGREATSGVRKLTAEALLIQ